MYLLTHFCVCVSCTYATQYVQSANFTGKFVGIRLFMYVSLFINYFIVKIYGKHTTCQKNMFLLVKRATFINFLKFSKDYGYSIV